MRGWKDKVAEDFSTESVQRELDALRKDPVYATFFLASREYVMVRLIGRMSISIGRRLGEIYDKVPRLIAQARFALSKDQVAPKMGGNLELDVCIPFALVSQEDRAHAIATAKKHLELKAPVAKGLGIEIRYNFNPNDSARLRKDVDMAGYLKEAGLTPIYLIFAENSPRDEAIARLKRAGWNFLVGREGLNFMSELVGVDINSFLTRPAVAQEIEREMGEMTMSIFDAAFKTLRGSAPGNTS